MGKMARDKGKRGELEFKSWLNDRYSTTAFRGQQHKGSPDSPDVQVPELEGSHLEVKRVERLDLYGAMNQAERDAGDKTPVVVHRRNRTPWLVTLHAEDYFNLAFANKIAEGKTGSGCKNNNQEWGV